MNSELQSFGVNEYPQKKSTSSLKHILLMFVPIISSIITYFLLMFINTSFDIYIWYILPIIISLIICIKFVKKNYILENKINYKVVIFSVLSLVISYGIMYFVTNNVIAEMNINLPVRIINILIDAIEMLLIYMLIKISCKKNEIGLKTVSLSISLTFIIEFIIRAQRVNLYLFFENFGFSMLTIFQILSILSSVSIMIIPAYAISLHQE